MSLPIFGDEIWKPISVNDKYEVSNYGRVKSLRYRHIKSRPSKLMSLCKNKKGYSIVTLSKNGKCKTYLVHRLAAYAFIGLQPSASHTIAHNDGNPDNNHISNLRWATHKENTNDKWKHGTMHIGENSGQSKLTNKNILKIKKLHKSGLSSYDIANLFDVCQTTIARAISGRTWKHII